MRLPKVVPAIGPIAALALAAGVAESQGRTIEVPYRVSCSQCTIAREKVVEIGGERNADRLGERGQLERDSRGRYYATGTDNASIAVFDSLGNYMRTFGRAGQGPGEFRSSPNFLIGVADTVFVFDRGARVISVFTPGYDFVRHVPLPGEVQSKAVLADGTILIGSPLNTGPGRGQPFHLLDATGRIIRSFGRSAATPERLTGRDALFVLAPDSTSIWTVAPREYRLEQWSLSGELLTTLVFSNVPWYVAPSPTPPSRAGAAASLTQLLARGRDTSAAARAESRERAIAVGSSFFLAGFDVQGRLWLRGSSPGSASGTGFYLNVIDVRTPSVIQSVEGSDPGNFLHGSFELTRERRTDADGVPTLVVWRQRLTGAGGAGAQPVATRIPRS